MQQASNEPTNKKIDLDRIRAIVAPVLSTHRVSLVDVEWFTDQGTWTLRLTIEREGPYGEGSLQHFIAADFEQHYFTLREDPRHHDRLKRICAFDLIANNADRKSGHCLLAEDGSIYGIDNGLRISIGPEPAMRRLVEILKAFGAPGARD